MSINQWSVGAIRGRDKQKASISFDEELAVLAASGINGLEPGLGSADQVDPLVAQLKKHGLELRSIYTGSALDDRAKVGKEVERIVALAKPRQEGGNEDHRDESQSAAESPGEERRATEDPGCRARQAGARVGSHRRHPGVPQPRRGTAARGTGIPSHDAGDRPPR